MRLDLPETLNIADRFLDARIREGRGDRIALRLVDRTLTYDDVQNLANRWGQALRRLGVRQEERVMIALPDGPEFVGALFGILKIGAVVVMVNPQFKEEEITSLLAYSRARVAIVDGTSLATFEQAMDGLTWPDRLLVAGADVPAGERFAGFEAISRPGDEILEAVETHRDDPAIWLFSGGTTGRPKGVVQSHRSFAATTELYARNTLGYHEGDITLSVPKLFFGYATGSNLFFPFSVGGSTILFPERPTPEVLFEKIRQHRPTILINVPTLINRMVGHETAQDQDLSCLRFATSAGEALPISLYQRWKEVFGVELLDGLGTAEMWHVFVTNRPGDVRPGTLGRVVEGFELQICDEDGRELSPGEVGRLWVRGPARALGYWQNQDQSWQNLRGDGFVGGDLARLDADGYLTYCGRSDDVLKVGGKWFVPQELESCLLSHPKVRDCAVVGALDEQGLNKPFAFVIADEDETEGLEAELKAHALSVLQPYKHPRRVIVVESFPRTHLGKVDRGALKRWVGTPRS